LQERGNAVHVWVVNDLADVDLCTELGVEALITDRPRAVRAHLERST
jgi:glycerophosphoryl diester phosphodiesterase